MNHSHKQKNTEYGLVLKNVQIQMLTLINLFAMKRIMLIAVLSFSGIFSNAQTYLIHVKPVGSSFWKYANLKGEIVIDCFACNILFGIATREAISIEYYKTAWAISNSILFNRANHEVGIVNQSVNPTDKLRNRKWDNRYIY
jgi:hypothetical protein